MVDLQYANTIHVIRYLCKHNSVYLRNAMVFERTSVAKHLRLQFSMLMSGLPVPYPAVGRLMDAGRPAVINSTSRVVFKSEYSFS